METVNIPIPGRDPVTGKLSLPAARKGGGRPGLILAHGAGNGRLPVRGLIFYGYPLHPPGHPEKLRDTQLYSLAIPLVFFEGTRDPFCKLDLLKPVLAKIKAPWNLEIIGGGDHAFDVPQSTGRTREEVFQDLVDRTLGLIDGGFFG